MYVCNKADPESKGPVENAVKFVKTSFFSARGVECVEDAWRSLPGWVDRQNRRIHQATFHVPAEVFEGHEKPALRPLLPSRYDDAPGSFKAVQVPDTPYVLYKSCHYSVPREHCNGTVCYKVSGGRIHIYDAGRKHMCSHTLSERKGAYVQLPEHMKPEPKSWLPVAERLRAKWGGPSFQHFLNGFKKENKRHLRQQLLAVEALLDAEAPTRAFVEELMALCCAHFRYRYLQFATTYFSIAPPAPRGGGGGEPRPAVQGRGMDQYRKAFEERCAP
jgi:hypothetical protein